VKSAKNPEDEVSERKSRGGRKYPKKQSKENDKKKSETKGDLFGRTNPDAMRQ